MWPFRLSLLSICALLAALPLTPCALLGTNCGASTSASAQREGRNCCEKRLAPGAHAPHQKPAAPCSRACCRTTTLAPVVQKVRAEQPLSASALLAPVLAHEIVAGVVPPVVATPASPALHILHCLWRC